MPGVRPYQRATERLKEQVFIQHTQGISQQDLARTFKLGKGTVFPAAKIVADRFHVIRLVNQFAMQTYQGLDERIKYNRGMLGSLRAKPKSLTAKRLERLEAYLKEQPAIAAVYEFKQRLHQLLMVKHRNQWQCLKLAPKFLAN